MTLGYIDSKRALALINAVGREPTPTAVRAFDEFFYPVVLQHVRKRHHHIGVEMGAKLGVGGSAAPRLTTEQADEAAHITAIVALRRARASARQFDPALGTAVGWVLRAANFAYLEVARQLARDHAELVDGQEPPPEPVAPPATTDPAEIFQRQATLDHLFLVLGDDERRVVTLVLRYKYTYAQTAEIMFGDSNATKRIDHLLQAARSKLALRWKSMQPDDDR